MNTTIGQMRERGYIEQQVPSADSDGGFNPAWTTVDNASGFWCRVEPGAGDRIVFGGRSESVVTHVVHLRYRSGIEAGMRFVWRSNGFRVLKIVNVQPDPERRMMRLRCQDYEVDND